MLLCKRPCFHNDYLPTFNRPNVHLVDTKGKGITEITEKGPVFEGKQYELLGYKGAAEAMTLIRKAEKAA